MESRAEEKVPPDCREISRTSKGRMWALAIPLTLVGQLAWIVENVFLNDYIHDIHPDNYELYVSLAVSLSAVVAAITTIAMGSLSDHVGRRKPFIVIGFLLWGLSTLAFGLVAPKAIGGTFAISPIVSVALVILLDCLMTFFGCSANDAALISYIIANTPNGRRGKVEGVLGIIPFLSGLVGFLLLFGLVKRGNLGWPSFFYACGGLVFAVGLVSILLIPHEVAKPLDGSFAKDVAIAFKPDTVKGHKALYYVIAGDALFAIAGQIWYPYQMDYIQYTMGFTGLINGEVPFSTFVLVWAFFIALVVIAIPITVGFLSDRVGRSFATYLSLAILGAGLLLMAFVSPIGDGNGGVDDGKTVLALMAIGVSVVGNITMASTLNARIRDLIPHGHEGAFNGFVLIVVSMLSMVTGPYIGFGIDRLFPAGTHLVEDGGQMAANPSPFLFVFAFGVTLLAIPFFRMADRQRKRDTITLNRGLLYPPKDRLPDFYPFTEDRGFNPFSGHDGPTPLDLCGRWDLALIAKSGSSRYSGPINVPYAPEVPLSKVNVLPDPSDTLVYTKDLVIPPYAKGFDAIVVFEGVDMYAEVYVDDILVTTHEGGYVPFEADLTPFVKDKDSFELKVVVRDPQENSVISTGKQGLKRGGPFFTTTTGIYKPVRLLFLPHEHVESIRLIPDLDNDGVYVAVHSTAPTGTAVGLLVGGEEFTVKTEEKTFLVLDRKTPVWSLANPRLIPVEAHLKDDVYKTRFGFREFKAGPVGGKVGFLLNGEALVIKGLLDHCYYWQGGLTPRSSLSLRKELVAIKDMGFNTIKVHENTQAEFFYDLCDEIGLLVIQGMPSGGKTPYPWQTRLGLLRNGALRDDTAYRLFGREDLKGRIHFEKQALAIQDELVDHPSVIGYTIFNQGWGEFDSARLYKELKANDSSRIIDTCSGWYQTPFSDLVSLHACLLKRHKIAMDSKRPTVLSKSFGLPYPVKGHGLGNGRRTVLKAPDRKAYAKAYWKFMKKEIGPLVLEGLGGYVVWQLADVEDERNGLWTYDRKVLKLPKDYIRECNGLADMALAKRLGLL